MNAFLIWWYKRKIRRCLKKIILPAPKVMFSFRWVSGRTMCPSLRGSLDQLSIVSNGVVFSISKLIHLSIKKYASGSDILNMRDQCVDVHGTITQEKHQLEVYVRGYTRFHIDY